MLKPERTKYQGGADDSGRPRCGVAAPSLAPMLDCPRRLPQQGGAEEAKMLLCEGWGLKGLNDSLKFTEILTQVAWLQVQCSF